MHLKRKSGLLGLGNGQELKYIHGQRILITSQKIHQKFRRKVCLEEIFQVTDPVVNLLVIDGCKRRVFIPGMFTLVRKSGCVYDFRRKCWKKRSADKLL